MPGKIISMNGRLYRISPRINEKTKMSKELKKIRHRDAKYRRDEKLEASIWNMSDDEYNQLSQEMEDYYFEQCCIEEDKIRRERMRELGMEAEFDDVDCDLWW